MLRLLFTYNKFQCNYWYNEDDKVLCSGSLMPYEVERAKKNGIYNMGMIIKMYDGRIGKIDKLVKN